MTFVPPCRRPENDPDDWFIGRDGKQYSDDDLVDPTEAEEVRQAALSNSSYSDPAAAADAAVKRLEDRAVRIALTKRRHARDKCHVECILRLQCLDAGLETENLAHGIWGGYYSDERSQIVKLRDERQARRNVAAEE